MLDTAAFSDLRSYIKRRVTKAKYYIGGTGYNTTLNDVAIRADGTVRVQLPIEPGALSTVTVTRVELYNSANELWAHRNCSISISTSQVGVLFWFDITIEEEEE
jgi:hypothetical protein